MKTYNSIIHLLYLTVACLTFTGCGTTTQPGAASAPPNSGHVLIYRVANFGSDLSLVVSVDGRDVGSFTEGANYDGYLPAGQHTLVVRADPNRTASRPGKKMLTVQAGQTYVFTAAWSGGKLVLVQGH
jgi:hypothetical protein